MVADGTCSLCVQHEGRPLGVDLQPLVGSQAQLLPAQHLRRYADQRRRRREQHRQASHQPLQRSRWPPPLQLDNRTCIKRDS
jgi:hypothetical protein